MSYTQNTQLNIVPKDMSDTAGLVSFLQKKNERLAAALYMVTEYLSDNDPIKWKMRRLALDILSYISDASHKKRHHNKDDFYGSFKALDVSAKVKEIVSLIEVALATGTVSQMNFTVLKNEYLKLLSLFDKIGASISFDSYLLARESEQLKELPERELSDKNPASQSISREQPAGRPISSIGQKSDNYRTKKEVHKSAVSNAPRLTKKYEIKNNRTDKIVTFLKGRGWTSIKDISELFTGVSSKTIQRELTGLVDKNVLKKKGERRWSRYSLN